MRENKYVRDSLRFFFGAFVLVLLYSCANMATPNGGPYDEAPPKFVSSDPLPNQLNFKKNRVEILFDELVQLDQPSENVIVTPPQRLQPVIQANGRRVIVEFQDTMLENETYTIDFTTALADNNEKNVLENFTFAFSTGETLDSLAISGILLNAENLEPMPGITIGVHTNLEDSAFTSLPFTRTSRTNDKGEFTIRNMAPGTYRVYALEDVMRTYRYSQPGQAIAFYDSLVVPTFELATRQDTLWKDTLTIDTIRTNGYTRFMPDDIELRLFKEDVVRQYMLRPERNDERVLSLRFNAPLDSVPIPVPLNFTPVDSVWYYPQTTEEGKTALYWLTDSLVWQQDTLRMEVDYMKSDSLNILRPQRDTVQFIARRRPVEKKKKRKDDEPEPIEFLGMTLNATGSINLYDTISVIFSEPVIEIDGEMFRLEQMVDSVWNPADFEFFPDSINSLKFCLKRPWGYGEEFRLSIDSAAIFSVYGKWNEGFEGNFKIKREDEYGHLYINIIGADSTAFVELLNSNDVPVRKVRMKDGGALFMDLKPDKYYARLVLDANGNDKWDTGDYAGKRQPELVFYCPKMFNIMQNWQVEETWDIHAAPFNRQKPLEITKNKPKEQTKKKRDYRNEGRQQSSSTSNSFRSLGF